MRHHHRRNYRKNFIILPIIFLCLGFFVLYLAVSPILRPFGDIASLIFLEERKSPSEEFDSIFDSAAEKPPVEQTAQETTIDASSFTFIFEDEKMMTRCGRLFENKSSNMRSFCMS